MQRIVQLSRQYVNGEISATEFRSKLIAQLSMLDDQATVELAEILELVNLDTLPSILRSQ